MIRVGIAGCGRILNAHLRGYRLLREAGYDNFRITGLFSRNRADAEMFRRRGEGPPPRPSVSSNPGDPLSAPHLYVSDIHPDTVPTVYSSLEEMIESGEVDAIDTPSSVFAHHSIALKAIAAGKHVLVEKPFSVSVQAGRLMVEAAQRAQVVLGVLETVRYAASSRHVAWAIKHGHIGSVQMVATVSIGTREWSPDRVVAQTPWRHIVTQAGGGATLDIGVHAFHDLRYACGEINRMSALVRTFEPLRFLRDAAGTVLQTVKADADDTYFSLFDFVNGGIGMASFTWAGHGEPAGLPDGRVIYGTRGAIKGGVIQRDGEQAVALPQFFEALAPREVKERRFPSGLTDTFALAQLDFLRAIENKTQMEASGEEGLRDVATAFAMVEASHAQQVVCVEDVLSGKVAAAQLRINEAFGLI
ncbi:MAG: Gfo/Idh/MocA family oxidoreductase [Chloroflexi bacterium]|nr:Gfo/Idh/MocA family oxidoreductase [Chloroflexota bacterium]